MAADLDMMNYVLRVETFLTGTNQARFMNDMLANYGFARCFDLICQLAQGLPDQIRNHPTVVEMAAAVRAHRDNEEAAPLWNAAQIQKLQNLRRSLENHMMENEL